MNEEASGSNNGSSDLKGEVEALKLAQATQAATMAGQAATTAATFAGTWSTILVGAVALIVGMFLGAALKK